MTRFAACFLLVFGQLAFGGLLAMAIPPFFEVERGFYKSSAAIYLSVAILVAAGFAFLAIRSGSTSVAGTDPADDQSLWISSVLWAIFCVLTSIYLYTLWTDLGRLRSRIYVLALAVGIVAVTVCSIMLKPASFGIAAACSYSTMALFSSFALGIATCSLLFGHWYLIDPNLSVDYLRTLVRLLGIAMIGELGAAILVIGALSLIAGQGPFLAVKALFQSYPGLLAMRILLGPIAGLILAWMCWQTLKIPQTMAATGLLYITVMAVLVGELLGHFILFRTAVPL